MITLYHHGSSVCAAKVRIALAEKSLPWEGVYVDILRGDQFDPAYTKLNPKAVVPTLVHDGNVIIESTVICEYLDECFPEPPLKPADPAHRAAMRLWTKAVDEFLHPGLRRDYLRELSPAHHQAFVAGKIRAISRQHAADFGDGGLARAQEGDRASRHGWRRGSTGRSACTTAICKRSKTRWRISLGSPATPTRSPTSP